MNLATLLCGFLSVATVLAGSRDSDPERDADNRNTQYLFNYQKNINDILANRTEGCRASNVEKRLEWSYLLDEHKQLYISAVKCLHSLPSQIDPSIMPGARSRYDDFTATHLLQTPYIHFNGLFLAFHRYYLHLFEQALRSECGYSGPTPYFDWSQWYKDPTKSELLNGSSTSFGGNGKYVPYRDPIVVHIPGGETLTFPPATGGGCIETGPFVDFQMHLGPVVLDPQGPLNGTGYNPRCITRDISTVVSDYLRPSNITKLFGTSNLEEFNNLIDNSIGLHASAHFMIGGIQMDPFASPSDPYFWPHHGMIDYLWTVWQGQDLENRPQQVTGTEIIGNPPGAPNVTLDSLIDFEILAKPQKQPYYNFISTIDGPFCYIYV